MGGGVMVGDSQPPGQAGKEEPAPAGKMTVWQHFRARPGLVAILFGLMAFLALSMSFWRPGIAWDEPHTVAPGFIYAQWVFSMWNKLSPEAIVQAWGSNFQHPPLAKVLMGLVSWALLQGGTQPLFSSRLVSVMAYSLVVTLLYVFVRRQAGGRVALYSTIAFLLLPRVMAEAQFATLDATMMLTWFLASWAFYEGMKEPRRAIWFGVAFGLALLTKLNSFFLPFVLFGWVIVQMSRRMDTLIILGALVIAAGLTALSFTTPTWVSLVSLVAIVGLRVFVGAKVLDVTTRVGLSVFILTVAFLIRGAVGLITWQLPVIREATGAQMLLVLLPLAAAGVFVILRRVRPGTALPNLVAMLTISPLVFLVGWPWLWPEPVAQFAKYLTYQGAGDLVLWIDPRRYSMFLTSRMVVPVYYLGKEYIENYAPWHYPWVLVWATTPIVLAWPMVTGVLRAVRMTLKDTFAGFVAVQVLGILLIHSLPWAPKYDGVRLFLPVFPFLAIGIGMGIERFCERKRLYEEDGPHGWWAILGVLLAVQAVTVIGVQPFGTSYYSMTVGGASGAHYLGFETSYWGEGLDWEMVKDLRMRLMSGDRVTFVAIGEFVPEMLISMGELPEHTKVVPLGAFKEGDVEYAVVAQREGWLKMVGINPTFVSKYLAPIKSTVTSTGVVTCRLLSGSQLIGGLPKEEPEEDSGTELEGP